MRRLLRGQMTPLSRLPARLPLKTCVAEIWKQNRRKMEYITEFSFRYQQNDNLIRRIYDLALENIRYQLGEEMPMQFTVEAFTDTHPEGFRIVIHRDDYARYLRGER